MKHQNGTKHRVLTAAAGILLLACCVLGGSLFASGFWDESTAVHIKPREIENSTLAIGTHLVHLSALTDGIYEIANKSAEDSGQTEIYYKSELGGDAWFDITSASTLEDITTGGLPVEDSVIEGLYFTHHTKSDLITYDLRTGEAVNIFDIRDPYDLESLEELSPLKMQYDKIMEMQGEDEVTQRIDQIWETEVGTPPENAEVEDLKAREEYDQIMAALQRYQNVLKDNDGGAAEIDKVAGVMEMVDAARRYLVYANVKPALDAYLDELGADNTEEAVTAEGDNEEVLSVDPELVSAVAECVGNVQNAMITYSGKMLSQGVTVISAAEYEDSLALIQNAQAGNHAACDRNVENLMLLDNILNDVVAQRQKELDLLEERLLADGTEWYTKTLWAGENGTYKAEKAKNSAQALLNRIITENEGEIETRRGELEFLINAWCTRMDAQSGMDFIDRRLELTIRSFSTRIPQDAFASGAEDSVQAHIDFLSDQRRKLELSLGGNEMDKLLAEKQELQTEMLSALDDNDLEGARKLEKELEDLEDRIRGMEERAAEQIADLTDQIADLENQLAQNPGDRDLASQLSDARADLAQVENSLSDGTLGAMIQGMKDAQDVEGLAGMLPTSPELVLPALQEIHDDLVLNGGDQSLIDAIEQAVLNNPNALRSQLSAEQIRQLAADFMSESGFGSGGEGGAGDADADLNDLSARDILALLAALQMYYDETGNSSALSLLASLARRQMNLGNPMLFDRINDSTGEYVSLSALQALTGRRFVWEKNRSLGVLAQGADFYGFTVYSREVLRDREAARTETMPRMAKYQGVIHIPEEYAYEVFGVEAVYLGDTDYACICDDSIMALAQQLLEQLLAA